MTDKKWDFLVVGCGLYGATFARVVADAGFRVCILDKRDHIGGNCYTESIEGINVHKYGAHIFHTSNEKVWKFVNRFASFNHYVNRPKVKYKGQIYSFPINLMTLYQLWGVKTPQEAEEKLKTVRKPIENPSNLEDWILSQVGEEIYETFIKGYTTKQWDRPPSQLPSLIVRRLPIRLTYDDNYFLDPYQGIPKGGYTPMIQHMIAGIDVRLGIDYLDDRANWDAQAQKILYTGKLDAFYDYQFGELAYRTLRFETKVFDIPDFQGNAVINHTEEQIPYTRTIEHKHFEFHDSQHSVVTWEFPEKWHRNQVPYYPINDTENNRLAGRYKALADQEPKHLFGGRLADYRYYDMHHAIAAALTAAEKVVLEPKETVR